MTIQELAQQLLEELSSGCEKKEIAGSIRRGRPDPKDIEIVVVPRRTDEMQELDLFGNGGDVIVCDHLHNQLQKLYADGLGIWVLDPVLRRNGPKYKRLMHFTTGVCADLFIVTDSTWGAQFVIRTGPADFSKALVTRALSRGMKQADGNLWRTHRDGTRTVIETRTEYEYFAALGLPYLEPSERTVRALYALEMKE